MPCARKPKLYTECLTFFFSKNVNSHLHTFYIQDGLLGETAWHCMFFSTSGMYLVFFFIARPQHPHWFGDLRQFVAPLCVQWGAKREKGAGIVNRKCATNKEVAKRVGVTHLRGMPWQMNGNWDLCFLHLFFSTSLFHCSRVFFSVMDLQSEDGSLRAILHSVI